jgi:hypothetical protein
MSREDARGAVVSADAVAAAAVAEFRTKAAAAILADLRSLQELMSTTTFEGNIEDRHRQQVRATALGWGMRKAAQIVKDLQA